LVQLQFVDLFFLVIYFVLIFGFEIHALVERKERIVFFIDQLMDVVFSEITIIEVLVTDIDNKLNIM